MSPKMKPPPPAAPQFDPTASLLLGLATTSSTDGTLDKATYQNFVVAPLAAPAPAAGQ